MATNELSEKPDETLEVTLWWTGIPSEGEEVVILLVTLFYGYWEKLVWGGMEALGSSKDFLISLCSALLLEDPLSPSQ